MNQEDKETDIKIKNTLFAIFCFIIGSLFLFISSWILLNINYRGVIVDVGRGAKSIIQEIKEE